MNQSTMKASFLSVAAIFTAAGAALINTADGFWNGITCLVLAVGVFFLREKLKK